MKLERVEICWESKFRTLYSGLLLTMSPLTPMLGILSLLWLWFSFLVSGYEGRFSSLSSPFKLTVLRSESASNCSVVSFGRTQHHKGLSTEHGYSLIENRSRNDGLDREISVFAHDAETIWSQVSNICSSQNGDLDSPQRPLSHVTSGTLLETTNQEPPRLRIERLIETGPIDNRVDLVFFSDGCIYLFSLF